MRTRGLKGKELEEAVTQVFSAEMDRITGLALAIVKPYQKMGEGLLETAIRVADTSRVINLELQSIGTSFGAVGVGSIKARMGLVDLMGGLEAFKSKTDFFKDNFLTNAEKLAPVAKAVSAEMARIGQSSVTTVEAFKALVLQQDLSTTSGQEMYVSLMNVAPAFKQVSDAAVSSASTFIESAKAISSAFLEVTSASVDTNLAALARSVDAEKVLLQKSYDNSVKTIQDKLALDREAANLQKEAATTSLQQIQSIFDTLNSTLKIVQPMTRDAAQNILRSALALSNAGGSLKDIAGLADALQAVTVVNDSVYATLQDQKRDQGLTANTLTALKSNAGGQVSVAKLTLDAITKTIKAIEDTASTALKALEKAHTEEVARLDGILKAAQDQLDAINGVNKSVLSIVDALTALTASLSALKANPVVQATKTITDTYQSSLGRAPDQAGLDYWKGQVAGGTSVTQVVDAIKNSDEAKIAAIYQSVLGRTPDAAGMEYWLNDLKSGQSITDIQKNFEANRINGSHADGLDRVPFDNYVANLHAGERVLTAKQAKEADTTAEEIRQMRADMNAALLSIAQNTGKTAKTMSKFDGDGMPATRTY